jgi:succinoglycan biosynthesis protein ExoA
MNPASPNSIPVTINSMESRCVTQLTSISVIVPVRNEEPFIERTLDYLLAQDTTNLQLEILVVDGQSDDQTTAIVKRIADRHPQVQLHHNPKRLSSAARNIGINESTGEYILIVDGHCEITDRQHLQKVVAAFQASQADCLGRPQPLDVEHASTLQRAIAAARSSRLGHHPESFIYANEPQFVPAKSVAVAYRRDLFDKVGLFDERFDAHEDGELNYRVDQNSLRCYFTPDIAIKYVPRNSLRALFRQIVRYGRGRVRFSRKHPGTWGWGVLVPALFVLYLVLGGLLAITSLTIALLYIAGIGVYAAAVTAASLTIALRRGQSNLLPWLPVVFFIVHFGAGTGLLAESLRPNAYSWLEGVTNQS